MFIFFVKNTKIFARAKARGLFIFLSSYDNDSIKNAENFNFFTCGAYHRRQILISELGDGKK